MLQNNTLVKQALVVYISYCRTSVIHGGRNVHESSVNVVTL